MYLIIMKKIHVFSSVFHVCSSLLTLIGVKWENINIYIVITINTLRSIILLFHWQVVITMLGMGECWHVANVVTSANMSTYERMSVLETWRHLFNNDKFLQQQIMLQSTCHNKVNIITSPSSHGNYCWMELCMYGLEMYEYCWFSGNYAS